MNYSDLLDCDDLMHQPIDEEEIWKPVPGAPGYEVSDYGRVRSYWKSRGLPLRGWKIGTEPVFMAGKCGSRGYPKVTFRVNELPETHSIHVLVLRSFVGPRPPGMQGCHNNNIKTDNRLSNLRWDTPAGNCGDKHKAGTIYYGEDHPTSVLTEVQAQEIINERAIKKTPFVELGKRYGVSQYTVYALCSGWTWPHLKRPERTPEQVEQDWKESRPVGEHNGKSKLTEAAVIDIRTARKNGIPIRDLVAKYKLSEATIRAAADGRSWKHVAV